MRLLPMVAPAVVLALAAGVSGTGFTGTAWAQSDPYVSANLLGSEVPQGKGDDDASGDLNGEIDTRRGRLCYYLDTDGLDDATSAAVYKGGKGDPGEQVIALPLPENGDEACVEADKALLTAIAEAPQEYFVEIRTPGHAEGAARGYLKH